MEKCTRHVSTGHHDLDITPAKQSLTMFKQPQHLQTASHPCTCHPLFFGVLLGLNVPPTRVLRTITGKAFNSCLLPSK